MIRTEPVNRDHEQITFSTVYRHAGRRTYLLALVIFGVIILILLLLWQQQRQMLQTDLTLTSTQRQLQSYSSAIATTMPAAEEVSTAVSDTPQVLTPTLTRIVEQPVTNTTNLVVNNVTTTTTVQEVVASTGGPYVAPPDNPSGGDIAGSYDDGFTIGLNAVGLSVDTTGDYLAGLSAGSGLQVLGSGGENATPTVSLDSALAIFKTIDASLGTDPVADSLTDTLSLTAGDGMVVTGDAAADRVSFSLNLAASSGLIMSGGALTLLNTCSDGQYLSWTNTTSSWVCTSIATTPPPNVFQTIAGDTGSAAADSASDTLSLVTTDGLSTAAGSTPDTVTLSMDLASGGGLAFSGGGLSLMSCSDGQILKRVAGSWACAADEDTVLASAYRQQLAGTDNRSISASLTPLFTNGSGTAQSLAITIGSGNEVLITASLESTTTVATGPITYTVVRDDNQDNDCATGGGDGTQIGGQMTNVIAALSQNFSTSFTFADTTPAAATNNYQICASTTIGLGTTSVTDRSVTLSEINL